MKIVRTLEDIPDGEDMIFLAGPSYRPDQDGESWRPDALTILENEGYSGTVAIPEFENNETPEGWTYSRQVDWEDRAMRAASVILFWIPRSMPELPGLTTNIEFGMFMTSGKIVAGGPPEADKNEYIEYKCTRVGIPWASNLKQCVQNALEILKLRSGAEIKVWFTSDTHFGHQRTLELSRRPFTTIEDMDWTLVRNWNRKIRPQDDVFFLGDFGNPEMLKYLNASVIYFLPGNYDNPAIMTDIRKDSRIRVLHSDSSRHLHGNLYGLVHEPDTARNPNLFYLYGHIHNLQKIKINGLNVGTDCHQFEPIDIQTVEWYRNAIENHYDQNAFMDKLGAEEPEGKDEDDGKKGS